MRDPKFQENEFFDPRDLVQVRYEMLRRVSVENSSVTPVCLGGTGRQAACVGSLPPGLALFPRLPRDGAT